MSKKNTSIDDFLNLPHLDDLAKADGVELAAPPPPAPMPVPEIELDTYQLALKAIEANLATVEATDHAKSLDVLFEETLQHSRDLMDLGFNTDPRSQRGIFEVANTMYKNAIDSKNSKREAQLKMLKIIQDGQKLQFEKMKWQAERGELPEAEEAKATIVEDRNELIKRAREQMKSDKIEATAEPTED
jgi:hypothetical protein